MRKTIGLSLALLVAAAPAMAKMARPAHHHSHPAHHPRSAATANASAAADSRVCDRSTRHHSRKSAVCAVAHRHAAAAHRTGARENEANAGPPDRYIGPLRIVGARQVGYAAWYGGRHLGRRTASGGRLDAVHATAAHRSLPLHSLVRVTNLRNGRSVVAVITDRGPVSHRLLIDVSPRAAAELDMIHSGIATVAVEPVAQVAASPQ
ncbi:MAG: septal ring lytic transglycosylase RlpA family protein [Thiohalocapsa sp.]